MKNPHVSALAAAHGVAVLFGLTGILGALIRFDAVAITAGRAGFAAAALLVVLGAGLLMETGGLSMAMGAFVAGVLLSESSFRHQLEADIEPFRGLLLGLFFLGVGMSLDLKVVAENWGIIVSGVIALMVVKGLCVYGVARLARSNHTDAMDRALLMAQGGEFAFVLYAAAANTGVIDATVNANMTAIIVLSMAITPLILILHRRFAAQPAQTREADTFDEHHAILVVGMGRFGQIVNSMLQMSGHSTTVIDLDPTTVAGFNRYGTKTHFGDASRPELLLTAGIENARLLVIAIDNREQALSIARFAREVNPNIDIVARAYDRLHTFDLYQAGANEIVRETFDAAIRAGKRALERLGMSRDDAEKVGKIFYRHDRHGMIEQARVYDPTLGPFKNEQIDELVVAQRESAREAIQAALRGEEEEWPHGDD